MIRNLIPFPMATNAPIQILGHLLFYISAGTLIYTFVLYPVLLRCLAYFKRPVPLSLDYCPTVSVLICAYNEGAGIHQKLCDTLALDYPRDKMQIVVVSDGSSDDTEQVVQSFADRNVKLLRTSRRLGKTNAQNEGLLLCTGEVVVFSDATTVYNRSAIRYLAAHYKQPGVGAVSGRYQYFDETGNSPTGAGSIAFWNYENHIKMSQSRLATLSGCCGCIYSVRRSAYTSLPPDIISDLVQPLHVIKKGFTVVFEPQAMAYEATTETAHHELAMRIRVITRAMRGLLSVPDLLNPITHPWLSFQLISHKILRWLIPIYLIGIFVGSALLIGEPRFFIVFLAQLFFYVLAATSLMIPFHRKIRVLGLPLYLCTMSLAAMIGVIQLLRGRKYVVWETVRS
jgi:cellulose synthase/poly-beta-1,6-N-acetylglucosamine synthase-like glycosyltransferase